MQADVLVVRQEEDDGLLVEEDTRKTILRREYRRQGTYCEKCFSYCRKSKSFLDPLCRGFLSALTFAASLGIGFAGIGLTGGALKASSYSLSNPQSDEIELYLALQLIALLGALLIATAALGLLGATSSRFNGALRLAVWLLVPQSVLALTVFFEGIFRADSLSEHLETLNIQPSAYIEIDARAAALLAAYALLLDFIFRRPLIEALLHARDAAIEFEMKSKLLYAPHLGTSLNQPNFRTDSSSNPQETQSR